MEEDKNHIWTYEKGDFYFVLQEGIKNRYIRIYGNNNKDRFKLYDTKRDMQSKDDFISECKKWYINKTLGNDE